MFLGLCSSSALPEEMGNGHMCDISNQLINFFLKNQFFNLYRSGCFLEIQSSLPFS